MTLVLCLNLMSGWSQTMNIKSVSAQPNDRTAIEKPYIGNGGDTCALIKIKTDNIDGIEFTNPNQYYKVSYDNGIYSVYLSTMVGRRLDFQHKEFLPVQLDMADYGFRKLRPGKTYLVVLDAHRNNELKSSVVLKVEPVHAKIYFDEQEYPARENGTFDIPVSAGRHHYAISADNYMSQNGSLTIGKSEVKTISVNLQPIMQEVQILCKIDEAHVFVDNIDYGKVGTMQIPMGSHNIRLQADGYLDSEQDVIVTGSTKRITFTLKENKNVTHVHATSVTIYSSGTKIYKDNKKVKEWSNSNTTIKLMPGKYEISDDKGNKKKIKVGSEPMEVHLESDEAVIRNQTSSTSVESSYSSNNSKSTEYRQSYGNSYNSQRSLPNSQIRSYNSNSSYSSSKNTSSENRNYYNGNSIPEKYYPRNVIRQSTHDRVKRPSQTEKKNEKKPSKKIYVSGKGWM